MPGVLGVLYDVHGNLPALEAVLDDARSAGVEGYVLGGDYALFGGWPAETVARLRRLESATWVRGNGERWTAAPEEAPGDPTVQGAIAACAESLGPDLVRELADLPERAGIDDAVVVHASPVSDVESFAPDPQAGEERLLGGESAPLLLFGHTHLPFARTLGGTRLVNPGSVGMPFDGDARAAYALLHPGGAVEHRRVDYDHRASADRVRGSGWGDVVARRVEQAAFA